MKNNESMEMYLETIYLISKRGVKVHSIDVATEMGYSKPSISRAMKLLERKEYIIFHQDGELELTDLGLKRAKEVYEKHIILTDFFVNLGASKKIAEDNACRIEHIISNELFEIIKEKIKDDSKNEKNG